MNDNKLIAEFMGLETAEFSPSNILNYKHGEAWFEEHELSYDVSWDWLMPVVNAIRVIDYTFNLSEEGIHGLRPVSDEVTHNHYNLEDTYKAVVEFIKQYNE